MIIFAPVNTKNSGLVSQEILPLGNFARCLYLQYYRALKVPIGGGFNVWFRSIAKVQAAAEFPVTLEISTRPKFSCKTTENLY